MSVKLGVHEAWVLVPQQRADQVNPGDVHDAFGARVDEDKPAIAVERIEALAHAVEDDRALGRNRVGLLAKPASGVDVDGASPPPHDLSGRVSLGLCVHVMPPIDAVSAANPVLDVEVAARSKDLRPSLEQTVDVSRVDRVDPPVVLKFLVRETRVRHQVVVEVVDMPLRVSGPNDDGQRLCQLREAVHLIRSRELGLLPQRDVLDCAVQASDLVVRPPECLAHLDDPPRGSVGSIDAQFFAEGRALLPCEIQAVPQPPRVVGGHHREHLVPRRPMTSGVAVHCRRLVRPVESIVLDVD